MEGIRIKEFTVTEVSNGFWKFTEADGGSSVDAYLLFGNERALLIDSLMCCEGLYQKICEITKLPLDVLVTHGHIDHAGASLKEFHEAGCTIYMDKRDYPILKELFHTSAEADWFTDVNDGQIFDLGGRVFEVISVPGHSPGSVVLLDTANEVMFTGDAIGSTYFWIHIPSSLSLDIFCENLQRLYDKTKAYTNLIVYPGHFTQLHIALTGQYILDTLNITKDLLSGALVGEDATTGMFGAPMKYKHISHGVMADYLYNPENMFSN